MSNKIGLVLSHVFVRENEDHKWQWIEHSIDRHKNLHNFYIILSGHGEEVPKHISDKVDSLYWLPNIREKDIGQGHPHFCIRGYEECLKNNCKFTLKNRAFDWLEHDNILNHDLVFCSTHGDMGKGELQDLLMFGETKSLLELWSCLDWDYSLIDGRANLFRNMKHLWNEDQINKIEFFDSERIGWKTMNDFRGSGPKYWGTV